MSLADNSSTNSPSGNSLVKLHDIRKSYGDNLVLKGVDMKVAAGEVVAMIGRSGSGKSTLLRTINGLERIDSGSIEVGGTAVDAAQRDLRALRLQVGMVFQQFNLFPHLTAGRNVMLAPTVVKKQSKAEVEEIARDALAKVGLADKFDSYPDQLSGGQQQRVAIARSLAMRPKVLLCDEITSALDPELVGEVLSVVRKLAEEGMTLILVTHEMRFAREVCDTLVFMHGGRIIERGDPEKVFTNPETPELAQFIGMIAGEA